MYIYICNIRIRKLPLTSEIGTEGYVAVLFGGMVSDLTNNSKVMGSTVVFDSCVPW